MQRTCTHAAGLCRLLEDSKAQAAARGGVSREEHARVVAENSQLAAQVGSWRLATRLHRAP